MSRTKRRTKNADYSLCVLTLFWGDHYMFDYRGRQKYESLQAMYDEEVAEVSENIRKYHSDLFKGIRHNDHVKMFVRDKGVRSHGRQALRKAFVSQEFEYIDFSKVDRINSNAKWNRH